jgi:Leucine-rich repeat (LRR) protein
MENIIWSIFPFSPFDLYQLMSKPMLTVMHTINCFLSPQQTSPDTGEFTDYYKILDQWKNEETPKGEYRDIAYQRIRDCVETGKAVLDLSGLFLTNLSPLPSHIVELNVRGNGLTTLPVLPKNLEILDASYNFLEKFPTIGPESSLAELHLAHNLIRIKPKTERELRVLDLDKNSLCFTIPKIIHKVWLGDKPLPFDAMRNLVRNASLNPDYEIKLWVDNPLRTQSQLIDAGFSSVLFKRVEILTFSAPAKLEAAILRECANTRYRNYPAASDILRLSLLKDFGGVYLDVDVALKEPLGDLLIENKKGQPTVNSLFNVVVKGVSDENTDISVSNNAIAAIKNSSDIDSLLEAIIVTYGGKEFTFANNNKVMDLFKKYWNYSSSENVFTQQIKEWEIEMMEIKLKGSDKSEALKALDGPEKRKHLEKLSNYKKHLFNENVDCNDITWGLKRELALVRHTGTLAFTGPGLIAQYLLDKKQYSLPLRNIENDKKNGFHTIKKFMNTEIFGEIIEPRGKWISENHGKNGRVHDPMGKWVPENIGNRKWAFPADVGRVGRSAEV